ncbi:MAG: ATP-binding protein [Deltaproteobacteria bacterium]|nr:ATP-binding protein [Deltaproteobacteria bacterium]
MFSRYITIKHDYSFFFFGPRGSGKSTYLRQTFGSRPQTLWIDLLDPDEEALFQVDPNELTRRCQPLPAGTWVVIDEVQKVPRLLNLVHKLIEERSLYFALSGSSARKLRRGGANLLAGRAFVNHLYPFTAQELAGHFDLHRAMAWGTLPKVWSFDEDALKKNFLQAYAHTYLKEEIQAEQIVRNLPTFRKFIEVAAQMNGQPINCSKVAREVRTDHTVVRTYFEILEDTLLGFHVSAYAHSLRRQQRQAQKFYFIDCGMLRALQKTLDLPVRPKTYEYGRLFEQFVISECFKHCQYRARDETLQYLRTKDGVEVDLIISRPGKATLFIEIKSTDQIMEQDCSSLARITSGLDDSTALVVSQDPHRKTIGHVQVFPWQEFFTAFLGDRL